MNKGVNWFKRRFINSKVTVFIVFLGLMLAGCGRENVSSGPINQKNNDKTETAKTETAEIITQNNIEETHIDNSNEEVHTDISDESDENVETVSEQNNISESVPQAESIEDKICQAAGDYYYSVYGSRPPIVGIDSWDGDIANVHLYEWVKDADGSEHTATYDWYYVDKNTGQTTNLFGESFNIFK